MTALAQGGPSSTAALQRVGAPEIDAGNACLRAVPKTAGRPATAYLGVPAADSISAPVRALADNFADVIAGEIRRELGAVGDTLPEIPPLSAGLASASVTLVLKRNAPLAWTDSDTSARSRRTRQMLLDALETAKNAGETIIWPQDLPGDSAHVRLHIDVPSLINGTLVGDEALPVAIPVYATRVLEEKPAAVRRGVQPSYPERNRRGAWSGTVIMQFVIDTTGRAEQGTMKDVWPRNVPRLKPELTDIYDDFLHAAKESIPGSTYYPAEIAGCKVRQVVRQAFIFNIRH